MGLWFEGCGQPLTSVAIRYPSAFTGREAPFQRRLREHPGRVEVFCLEDHERRQSWPESAYAPDRSHSLLSARYRNPTDLIANIHQSSRGLASSYSVSRLVHVVDAAGIILVGQAEADNCIEARLHCTDADSCIARTRYLTSPYTRQLSMTRSEVIYPVLADRLCQR